jgi:hypothetical protein
VLTATAGFSRALILVFVGKQASHLIGRMFENIGVWEWVEIAIPGQSSCC